MIPKIDGQTNFTVIQDLPNGKVGMCFYNTKEDMNNLENCVGIVEFSNLTEIVKWVTLQFTLIRQILVNTIENIAKNN